MTMILAFMPHFDKRFEYCLNCVSCFIELHHVFHNLFVYFTASRRVYYKRFFLAVFIALVATKNFDLKPCL